MLRRIAVLLSALLLVLPGISFAQSGVASNTATVSLSANVAESLTVSATPASLTFNLSGAASSPITITSTYNVNSSRINFAVAGYFSSSTALTNSGPTISTSQVFGSMDGGAAVACNGTADFGPVGQIPNACPRAAKSLSGVFSGTFTDTLTLSIPGLGSMTPGAYTGVINISAAIW